MTGRERPDTYTNIDKALYGNSDAAANWQKYL